MHVPADDQRVGPTWTRNGWVYPRTHGYGEPIPYADTGQGLYGLKDFDRPRAPWRDERPRHWRR